MTRIRIVGAALVAVLAFGVSGVASAAAHEFVASKAGKTKTKARSSQVFKTGAGTVECNHLTGKGEVKESELKSATHKETVTYSECFGFGISEIKVTAAKFLFNANGEVTLENTITVTPVGAECEVLIAPQVMAKKVTYKNEPAGKITSIAAIENIKSKGTGGFCGGINETGTYSGSSETELEGGTIEWK